MRNLDLKNNRNVWLVQACHESGFTRLVDFGFVFEKASTLLSNIVAKINIIKRLPITESKTFSKPKFTTGFTLVELMVAIAVFSIVMVTAMSALLNVVDANNKARSVKTAINNISFALEGISKDMRVGTDYSCASDFDMFDENNHDCPTGGNAIKYRSTRADKDEGTGKNLFAFYYFHYDEAQNISRIEECLQKNGVLCDSYDQFEAITSEEVKINKVVFYVLGVNKSFDAIGSRTQPRMIMTINGEAGTKEKIKTTFDLQTSVSQRIRPNKI